jgi:hypothetical protein
MADTDHDRQRFELGWIQILASALAAVSGAVAASGLGVAGTFLGAGVVSLVATIGGALYGHLFQRSAQRLRQVPTLIVRTSLRRPDPHLGVALAEAAPTQALHRGDAWRPLAAAAVAIFMLAVTGITLIEITTGRSLSSLLGTSKDNRSSIIQLVEPNRPRPHEPRGPHTQVRPTPADTGEPSASPSESSSPASPPAGFSPEHMDSFDAPTGPAMPSGPPLVPVPNFWDIPAPNQ